MTRPLPQVRAAAASRRGPLHQENEDAWRIWDAPTRAFVEERGRLFAVCDGVSTAGEGRMAARLTVERLSQFFEESEPSNLDTLIQLVGEIDWELRGTGKHAACTLSVLWLHHWTAHVLTVGDSPVYRLRKERVSKAREASGKGGRALRAYLGMGPAVSEVLRITRWRLAPGDVFMVASDGVSGVVGTDGLKQAWARTHDPVACADKLIGEVAASDGEDDATVVVVEIGGVDVEIGDTHPHQPPEPPNYLNFMDDKTEEIKTD